MEEGTHMEMSYRRLEGKKITLCLTGAISAYKGLELARLLVKAGAEVSPAMTESAGRFVSALSLGVLARGGVFTDIFCPGGGVAGEEAGGYVRHIDLARDADLLVIAPATANIIGKIASGIADCPVSLLAMATRAPVLIAPSMNTAMWENRALQENVSRLRSRGCLFVGPEAGELACNTTGMGRMAEPASVMEAVIRALTDKDLAGERVLVTSGPTREYMDPVRFISNASSGRMGHALAREARLRGADVELISGPVGLKPPEGVEVREVTTAKEMREAAMAVYEDATIIIAAAAVSDFAPAVVMEGKIKKDALPARLDLRPTPDILMEMGGRRRPGQILVGFALETENALQNAERKLREKHLDMVVANSPSAMERETSRVVIISRKGDGKGLDVRELPEAGKDVVAGRVLDHVRGLRSPGPRVL